MNLGFIKKTIMAFVVSIFLGMSVFLFFRKFKLLCFYYAIFYFNYSKINKKCNEHLISKLSLHFFVLQ